MSKSNGRGVIFAFVAQDNIAVIGIVDLSGKTVYQTNAMLSAGSTAACVTGIKEGMCLLKVTGKNYFYSTKLISQGKPECTVKIQYVPSDQINLSKQLKSSTATIDMQYNGGDQFFSRVFRGYTAP